MAEADVSETKKNNKKKLLDQIKSLDEADDERKATSKKISWILRHGAQKVKIKMDAQGWVKMDDLVNCELLEDLSKDTIMGVINESNEQKLRYELKDNNSSIRDVKKPSRERKTPDASSTGKPPLEVSTEQTNMSAEAQAFIPGISSPSNAAQMSMMQGGYWPNPWAAAQYQAAAQYAAAAYATAAYGFMPGMMPGANASMYGSSMNTGAATGRYRGRIKSFNAEKGFGFIECDETHAQFQRDVFLHKAHIGNLPAGSEVTFTIGTNKNGMPQAKDLAPVAGAPVSTGKGGKSKGKGAGKGKGRGKGKKDDKEKKETTKEEPAAAPAPAESEPAPAAPTEA